MRLSFRNTMLFSVFFATIGVVSGLFMSAIVNVATSGVIVFTCVAIFLFTALYKKLGDEPSPA